MSLELTVRKVAWICRDLAYYRQGRFYGMRIGINYRKWLIYP